MKHASTARNLSIAYIYIHPILINVIRRNDHARDLNYMSVPWVKRQPCSLPYALDKARFKLYAGAALDKI